MLLTGRTVKGNENDKLICSGRSSKDELISIYCDVAKTGGLLVTANYFNTLNDQICKSEHGTSGVGQIREITEQFCLFLTNDMSVAEGQFRVDGRDKSSADPISARMKFWKLRMATTSLFCVFFWLLW